MKSKENRIGLITLDLPYEPDTRVNLMSGKIEGKKRRKKTKKCMIVEKYTSRE